MSGYENWTPTQISEIHKATDKFAQGRIGSTTVGSESEIGKAADTFEQGRIGSETVGSETIVQQPVVSEEDSSNCVDLNSEHRAEILKHLNTIEDIIKAAKGLEGLENNVSNIQKQANQAYLEKRTWKDKLYGRKTPTFKTKAKRVDKIKNERILLGLNRDKISIERNCKRKYRMFSPKRNRCIKNDGPERQAAMQGGKKMTKKRLDKNTRKNRRNRRN